MIINKFVNAAIFKLLSVAVLVFTLVGCSSGSDSSETMSQQAVTGLESAAGIGNNDNAQVAEIDAQVDATDTNNNVQSTSPNQGSQESSEQLDETDAAAPADDDAGTANQVELEQDEEQEPIFQTEEEALEQDTQLASNSENDGAVNEAQPTSTDNDDVIENEQSVENEEAPATAITPLQLRLQMLTGRTLQALNQSLSQGEFLSERQELCIGSYDPAIGAPLLAITCEPGLATGEVQIYANNVSVIDTPECRASVTDVSIAATDVNCTLEQAMFTVHTIWTESRPADQVGRPQPTPGATITFNANENILRIENLEQRLSGTFICEYQLDSGNLINDTQVGSCSNEADRITGLIDLHFANAEP